MNSLVKQVVEVLNEGSPYMDGNRVLKKYLRKAPPRKRFIPRPAKTTGERDTYERSKEQQRKLAKTSNPHSSLRWDGYRWTIREIEQALAEVQPLLEISLRTASIAGLLMMLKKYHGQVKQGVMKRKSLSTSLLNASDEKERNRIESEIEKITGEADDALANMISYVGYVSGAGGLGADRSYKLLKKMEKKKRR